MITHEPTTGAQRGSTWQVVAFAAAGASVAIGWFAAMVAGFGGPRAGGHGLDLLRYLATAWLLCGALGIVGVWMACRWRDARGGYVEILAGAVGATASWFVGAGLAVGLGSLLMIAGAVTVVGRRGERLRPLHPGPARSLPRPGEPTALEGHGQLEELHDASLDSAR